MLRRRVLLALSIFALAAVHAAGQEKAPAAKGKSTPPASGTKVLLKWKFEKDKPFYQKMNTVTKQSMKVMNSDNNQTQNQTFYFVWTPVKQEGDNWIIKQKIEGISMDIDMGGAKIAYDSTKSSNANSPLTGFFQAMLDAEFELTLNKDMKVTKITGREEFVKKLSAANPQMKPLLDQILSEDALKEMADPTFQALPGKEVAKGESWTRESSLNMGPIGKYDNKYTYTFEGPDEKDKKLDRIKVTTALTYKEPSEAVAGGGLPFRIKSASIKSTGGSGTILYDPAKGRITKSTMNLELKGDLNIEVGGQTTKVDLSQTQSTNVETTDSSQLPKKS